MIFSGPTFESAEEALGRHGAAARTLARLRERGGWFHWPKIFWDDIIELQFALLKDDIEFDFDCLRIQLKQDFDAISRQLRANKSELSTPLTRSLK